jgi:hypothetical protein
MPPTTTLYDDFFYDYWIGKDSSLEYYWRAYHEGKGYQQKFQTMQCHVFEITFEKTAKELPLFNLEPLYKTLKAYYHDFKRDCLSEREYNNAGPLFIYEINRGSGIWTWLGEVYYTLILGTTLTEEKIKGQRLDNLEKKLRILKEHFGEGNVRPELFEAFMKAGTPDEMESALQNLFQEKILDVRISKFPVITTVEEARKEMISLKEILEQANKI